MVKRTLVAIPAIGLLVAAVYFHGLFAKIVVAAVSVLCTHEMMRVFSGEKGRPFYALGYIFAALLLPAYEFAGGFLGIAMLLGLCLMSIFIVMVFSGRSFYDGLMSIFTMVYPGIFCAFWVAVFCIPEADTSRFLILMLFASAALTDSFAYFSGMLFGKHKLIPRISPKKTIEGAVGGLVLGTASITVAGFFLQRLFGLDVAFYWYIILGVVLSVLTQIGDLAASIIKRRFDVKDYGSIMAGHGGAMDRLDSSLFISPVIYLFYIFVIL